MRRVCALASPNHSYAPVNACTTFSPWVTTVLPRWPGHVAPTKQVQMQMEHRLSRARPNVVDGAISVLDTALTAELRRDELAIAEDLGVFRRGFLQSHNVPLGNNEHVGRRFGVDVFENVHLVVFVNLLRRDLPRDDLAEEAIVHDSMLSEEKQFSHGFSRMNTDNSDQNPCRSV